MWIFLVGFRNGFSAGFTTHKLCASWQVVHGWHCFVNSTRANIAKSKSLTVPCVGHTTANSPEPEIE